MKRISNQRRQAENTLPVLPRDTRDAWRRSVAFYQDPDQLVDQKKQLQHQRQRVKNQIYCRRDHATSGFPMWENALPVSRVLSLVFVPGGLSFLADPVGTRASTGGQGSRLSSPAVPTRL